VDEAVQISELKFDSNSNLETVLNGGTRIDDFSSMFEDSLMIVSDVQHH